MIQLGVNIDHIATIRQARKTFEPDPVTAPPPPPEDTYRIVMSDCSEKRYLPS